MFVIIRHNEITGHRYVHRDGQVPMTFKDRVAAERELVSIRKHGTHAAVMIGIFRTVKQAAIYCTALESGLSDADAIEHAIS